MKKIFLLGAIAALALVACQKEQPAEPQSGLVYDGKNVIEIAEGTNFYTVNFKANKDWEALINAPDLKSGDPSVTIDKTKGTTGDQSIKVTFEDLEEGDAGRPAIMCVSTGGFEKMPAAGEYFIITFIQGKVFLVATEDEDVLGAEGGEVSYQIITNCAYETKKYDQFEEWAPATIADGVLTFDVKPNPGYDAREAYVKFTVAEIQVPVYDPESGEPTGETEAYVARAYVTQEGLKVTDWQKDFDQTIALPSTHTIAKFGDKVYVANAQSSSLFAFDAETGTAGAPVELSTFGAGYVNSVAADDKGNLAIAFGGNYPLESEPQVPLQVYVVPAGKDITLGNATKLFEYPNGFYGYGLDNMKVNGDLTADAAITLVSAVGYDGGTYSVSWQITGGKYTGDANSYTTCSILPTGTAIWYSGDLVAINSTSNVNNGLFYIGYDSHYDLCYNPGVATETWSHVWVSGSSWAENYSGIDYVEWNGHKYLVVLGTAFFCYWGMPSYLTVLNVDDPTRPGVLSSSEIYTTDTAVVISETYVNETTGDVCATVEDGDLAVYVVDAGVGQLLKITYPAGE